MAIRARISQLRPHHIHGLNSLVFGAMAAVVLLLSSVSSQVTNAEPPTAPTNKIWTTVWSEDFTSGSLDAQSWSECDGAVDARFGGQTHPHGCAYNCPSSPPLLSGECDEQAWFSGNNGNAAMVAGTLRLKATYSSSEICSTLNNPSNVSGSCPGKRVYNYHSGMVQTGPPSQQSGNAAKRSFGYGYFEVLAKLPTGNGAFPSIRLLPDNSSVVTPRRFAIVLLEGAGGNTSSVSVGLDTETGSSRANCGVGQDLATDGHRYGVDWQADYAKFYIDGTLCSTITNTALLADAQGRQLYVQAANSVGGNACVAMSAPCPQPSAFPTSFYIDQIKVYAHKEVQTPSIQSYTFSPTYPTIGEKVTLSWSSSADSCSIDHGVGSVNASGTATVNPTVDTLYTLTCLRDGESIYSSADIEVFPKEVTKRVRKRPLAPAFVQDTTILPPSEATAQSDFEVGGRAEASREQVPASAPLLGLSSRNWQKIGWSLAGAAAVSCCLYLYYLKKHHRLNRLKLIPL